MTTKKSHLINMITMYSGLPKEVYVLFFGKLINCIGSFIYPLIASIFTIKMVVSVKDTSIFMSILCIFQMISTILGGKLVDVIGRKKVMVIFPTLSALCYIVCGILPLSKTSILLIFLGSAFQCIASSSYDAMIADVTDESNRKTSYSLIYMGLNLGYAVGPSLGGFLFKNNLPLVFIGDGVTTILSSLLILFTIKETTNLKINNSDNAKLSFEQAEEGSVFKVLISRPSLICYFVSIAFVSFTYNQLTFALPLRLQDIFSDNSPMIYGSLLTVNGIVVMLFTPVVTYITKKISIINTIVIGVLTYVIGFSMLGLFDNIISLYLALIIISLGEIAISTNSGTLINNLTPSSHRGRVNSLRPLSDRLGTVLGTYTMGLAITSFGTAFPFYFVGLLSILSAMLVFSLHFTRNYDKATI